VIERKLLLENLLRLRSRIENWTQVHGWTNLDNHRVKKDKQGRVIKKNIWGDEIVRVRNKWMLRSDVSNS